MRPWCSLLNRVSATISGCFSKMGPLETAGYRAEPYTNRAGVTTTEVNRIDDAIVKLGIDLYPVVDTEAGGSPPLPVFVGQLGRRGHSGRQP